VVCSACTSTHKCDYSRAVGIVKEYIRSDSSYTMNYKELEFDKKDRLFREMCLTKKNLDNFILLETRGDDYEERIGLFYDYNDNELYSCKQGNSDLKD